VKLTDTVSEKMSDIFKPQRRFIPVLLTTVMLMRGRVDFRNLSRYGNLSEKTFSLQFRKPSDFAQFNGIGTEMSVRPHTLMIAATDTGFVPESGSHTYGLDKFYNGTHSEIEKGLGISQLAVADVDCNTAYSVSAWQTPDLHDSEHTRTDRYPEQFRQDARCLPSPLRYPAADGYYAEKKFADGVCDTGYHLISELRHDADLRYLYNGRQKARGRHRLYDGKIYSGDLSRSDFVSRISNLTLCTAVVNSPSLKRNIRIVYLLHQRKHKVAAAILFSADIHLPPTTKLI